MVKTSGPWSRSKDFPCGGGVRLGFEGGQTPLFVVFQNVDLQTSTLKRKEPFFSELLINWSITEDGARSSSTGNRSM